MRHEGRADGKPGSTVFLFLPFMLGFVLSRFFGIKVDDQLVLLAAVSLCLILFAGASLYGRVTLAAAFVILGSCASFLTPGISLFALTEHHRWKEILYLVPLFIGCFCAAYLGLRGSVCLSGGRFSSSGSRMKECMTTSLIQGLILLVTAVLACLLKT